MRGWLLVAATFAGFYALFSLTALTRWDFVGGVVVAAVLVMVWGFLRCQEDREARMRAGRDAVFQRRIREARQRGERLVWVAK